MRKRPERLGEAQISNSGLLAYVMQNLISRTIGILFLVSEGPRVEKFRILGWPFYIRISDWNDLKNCAKFESLNSGREQGS